MYLPSIVIARALIASLRIVPRLDRLAARHR